MENILNSKKVKILSYAKKKFAQLQNGINVIFK